ncbi:MAG: hypothetical protein IPL50_05950 [Chitinophagaceae bacterium]|nr:hypothetical protein [Chitinophagaceae bacterium]
MKKIILTLAVFITAFLSMAQSPNLMNYQGVARNAAGNVLPNQNIGLRLSIVTGSPHGYRGLHRNQDITDQCIWFI